MILSRKTLELVIEAKRRGIDIDRILQTGYQLLWGAVMLNLENITKDTMLAGIDPEGSALET